MQIPAQCIILSGGPHFPPFYVFIKFMYYFFQLVLSRWLNNKLGYLVQYLVPIFNTGIHKYSLFCSEIVLYFLS